MRVGMFLRNMGPASTPDLIAQCAKKADELRIDDLWVLDHIAIPKEESEGSGGRYVDPLATLAFAAGATEHVGLGVSVLILPYRPPLATAKWVAAVQELSKGRLTLGVGVGWMAAEFNAVGADRSKRGQQTDETLEFFNHCFMQDECESNGQSFLFLPRPPRPQFLIGGAAPQAIDRAIRYGDGWMPIGKEPEEMKESIQQLCDGFDAAGKPAPEVIPLKNLPLDNLDEAASIVQTHVDAGATGIEHPGSYESLDEFSEIAEKLISIKNMV